MYKALDETLKTNWGTLLKEVNHFLLYVQDKFSEVLIPVDNITKQDLIGKGC